MKLFNAWDLAGTIENLTRIRAHCSRMVDGGHGNQAPSDSWYELAVSTLKKALELCVSSSFKNADLKLRLSLVHVDSSPRIDASSLGTELRNVHEALVSAILNRKFLQVPKELATYVDHEGLFGETVATAFPSAAPDIREAGNCLAADCNTAAVFHMMRAVEWGLRALCVKLGFSRLRTRNRKTGKVTYRLIEYTEWETILNQLQDRVDAKLAKIKRGPNKQLYQEFYYPVLQDIRGIRDAWRNHVMHTRSEYTRKDAEAILDHVRRLMVKLSGHLAEA